jgi:hypothetical protein
MSSNITHEIDRRKTASLPLKQPRSNAFRSVQVLPPHNVDLTLSPETLDEIHAPSHVSGANLAQEGPRDGNEAMRARLRRR